MYYKIKIEKELNAALDRDNDKIVEHSKNVLMLGKCNGDCGCLILHQNLKTANQAHSNQAHAKPSADGKSQVMQ